MALRHRSKKIIEVSAGLGLALLGIIIALGLAEFAARYALSRPYPEGNGDLWTCDRTLGWRGKPNTQTVINTEGYVHTVVRNSKGMHDSEHPLDKRNEVFRILVIGDSFVEARQVEEAETSASVLEASLNAGGSSGRRYEVISAGASAWGPAQELLYFETEGKFYQPDLVVAYWYPANDLMDLLPDHRMTFEGVNCYAPYFAICDDQFDSTPWYSAPGLSPTQNHCSAPKKFAASLLNWFYFNSRLYQHLEPLLTKYQPRIKYEFNFSPWLEDQPDDNLAYAYRVTDGIYARLADEASQTGAQVAVVVVPLKEALYYELAPAYHQQIESDYPELKNHANPALPNQTVTQLLAAQNIPVFDLQPGLLAHLKAGGGVLYGEVDSHWNVPGNQLVGTLIAQWLIDNQLASN